MIIHSAQETIRLGEKLAAHLEEGMTVLLEGDLASGKTTFTKGIGKGLGIRRPISSPTFNILKIYHGDKTLYHIDAYRLENSDYDLGLDEFSEDGITVVEWPEYYTKYLPEEYLKVRFAYLSDNEREIIFEAYGDRYERLLDELKGDL